MMSDCTQQSSEGHSSNKGYLSALICFYSRVFFRNGWLPFCVPEIVRGIFTLLKFYSKSSFSIACQCHWETQRAREQINVMLHVDLLLDFAFCGGKAPLI